MCSAIALLLWPVSTGHRIQFVAAGGMRLQLLCASVSAASIEPDIWACPRQPRARAVLARNF